MTRRHDLAVFDFDGTLADSFPFFLDVHNELARKHGFPEVASHEVEALRALPTRELAARAKLPPWKLPVVARDFIARMQAADAVPVFEGIAEVLDVLASRGLRLAIVTSNGHANVARVLGAGLLARFELVDCGASMFGKASRLRRVLRTLRVPPDRAIYLGDQTADGEAARAAGLAFGAVGWGYATPSSLEAIDPSMFFRTPSELLALLEPS